MRLRCVTIYIRGGQDTVQTWMDDQTADKVRGRFHRDRDRPTAALAFTHGDTEHLVAWDHITRITIGPPMDTDHAVIPAVLVGVTAVSER